MDKEQMNEWLAFNRVASDKLNAADIPNAVLNVNLLPAFGNQQAWCLYPERVIGKFSIQRRTWDQDADREKFRTPVERLKHPPSVTPTILQKTVPVDAQRVTELKAQLCSLRISPWVEKYCMGLDGYTYTISFGALFCTSSFSWWVKPPDEWRDMVDAVFGILIEADAENKKLLIQ